MGIKVVPTDPKTKASSYQKDWKKWNKIVKTGEPTPPEGMSDFQAKLLQGKIKPGKKPVHRDSRPVKEKKPSGSVGPETISLAIGGPIESPMEKKQKPLYEEELGMYGGGAVRKKMYARGGGTRPTRG